MNTEIFDSFYRICKSDFLLLYIFFRSKLEIIFDKFKFSDKWLFRF